VGEAVDSLLEPAPAVGAGEPAARHPVLAALAIVALGYAVLTAVFVAIGQAIEHPLQGTVGDWDDGVAEFFERHRTDFLDDLTKRATSGVSSLIRMQHADLPLLIVGAVVILLLVRRGLGREGAGLAIALALELTVFDTVKILVGRPRPAVFDLSKGPSHTSFPSGHTAAATVLFVGIAVIVTSATANRIARIVSWFVAVAIVVVVGFARVYRGQHFLTDCVCGVLLGLGCLAVSGLAMRQVRPARHAIGRP
jgi:membrane-associated phospholipid phosphatase